MQASVEWIPPAGTLGAILETTRKRLAESGPAPSHGAASPRQSRPSLRAALQGSSVAVIAEVKRRSPSRGEINAGLSAADQARRYSEGGAAAISVLTEPTRFGGSMQDLDEAARSSKLPLLKKDFHISRAQIAEAAASPASAMLLIARAVPPIKLMQLMDACRVEQIEALVEIRTEAELETALRGRAEIIGVNSRNLETLEIDDSVPARLIPLIPADIVAVWESGIREEADVRRAAEAGADAVLVGSELSRSSSPEEMLRALASVQRSGGGRRG